jgi:hypothetical protein
MAFFDARCVFESSVVDEEGRVDEAVGSSALLRKWITPSCYAAFSSVTL